MFCQQLTNLTSNINISSIPGNDVEVPEPIIHHHLISSSCLSNQIDLLELRDCRQAIELSRISQIPQDPLSIAQVAVSVPRPLGHMELGIDLAFKDIRMGTGSKLSDYEDFSFGPGSSDVVDSAARRTDPSG
jgi:hypothetical protein